MSVPTMRTPRSPFMRSARSSAAVPGAPDAVTRTVMSRISRAMLLGRVDARVDQLEEGLDVEFETERRPERHAVRDHVHEMDDRLERDVDADVALPLPRLEERQRLLRLLGCRVLEVVHQLGIRA